MPSTYSTNLKLELMATGEKNNLWGDVTNTNLGTLLEQAIVGSATVAMADSNQTISITNGTSADGRCFYIKCTGANTDIRNLVVPTLLKTYAVENATSGGFGVLVKTSGGTGITVAPGTVRMVYADGTNVIDLQTGFGNISAGAVTATSYNGLTIDTTTGTFDLTNGKTFAVTNSITLSGTDSTTYNLNSIVPPGTVFPYAVAGEPSGYLACNGQAVSRATYSVLFGVIGTTYGSGDGSTTFNVPDLRGRIVAGSDSMGASAASRLTATTMSPNGTTIGATGGAQTEATTVTSTGTAFTNGLGGTAFTSGLGTGVAGGDGPFGLAGGGLFQVQAQNHFHFVSGNASIQVSGNASVSVSGTTAAATNVQPTMIMYYIIKV